MQQQHSGHAARTPSVGGQPASPHSTSSRSASPCRQAGPATAAWIPLVRRLCRQHGQLTPPGLTAWRARRRTCANLALCSSNSLRSAATYLQAGCDRGQQTDRVTADAFRKHAGASNGCKTQRKKTAAAGPPTWRGTHPPAPQTRPSAPRLQAQKGARMQRGAQLARGRRVPRVGVRQEACRCRSVPPKLLQARWFMPSNLGTASGAPTTMSRGTG